MKELMQELVQAMVESATDELGHGYPEWQLEDAGFDTPVIGLSITTRQSRDSSRSRNGGEYFGYAFFGIRPDGVEVWEGSSCELVSRAEEKARSVRMYPLSLTSEGLERMAHLAAARALQQVAPDEALDPTVAAVIEAAVKLASKEIGFREFKAAVRASETDFLMYKGRSHRERKEALRDFIELAEATIGPMLKAKGSKTFWLKALVSAKDAVEGW